MLSFFMIGLHDDLRAHIGRTSRATVMADIAFGASLRIATL
jgi:hypothetical protein